MHGYLQVAMIYCSSELTGHQAALLQRHCKQNDALDSPLSSCFVLQELIGCIGRSLDAGAHIAGSAAHQQLEVMMGHYQTVSHARSLMLALHLQWSLRFPAVRLMPAGTIASVNMGQPEMIVSSCHVQLWAMGRGSTLWRSAPGLLFRLIEEVICRAVAVHGPPALTDFDAKLVRADLINSSVGFL